MLSQGIAREVGADEGAPAFDRIIVEMAAIPPHRERTINEKPRATEVRAGLTTDATPFQSSGNSLGAVPPPVASPRAGGSAPAPALDRDFELVAFKEDPVFAGTATLAAGCISGVAWPWA